LEGWVVAIIQEHWKLHRRPGKVGTIEEAFRMLDNLINPINVNVDLSPAGLGAAFDMLRGLNIMLYEERNNTFIKIKRQMSDIDKIMEQDFGILPKAEREKIRKGLESGDLGGIQKSE
jgi:hypothetical protein